MPSVTLVHDWITS